MLFVAEIETDGVSAVTALQLVAEAIEGVGEVIESQATQDGSQLFSVLEAQDQVQLQQRLSASELRVKDLAKVRLVGAELEDIKKLRPSGQYLVEWDFPEGLTMDKYLARKKEKSPLYEGISDVQFLRTYVREDMVKCLCFYDGESEEAVLKAREVVETPVSRIHQLSNRDS